MLRQVPSDIPIFTKQSPLGKRHNVVKVTWPINYWVIDQDTHVKVSPALVKSVTLSSNVGDTISKSNVTSHWLPIAAPLTIMDPNQPEHVMKLPFSIEHFLTRNNLLRKCPRGTKVAVRIANEQRISTNKKFRLLVFH